MPYEKCIPFLPASWAVPVLYQQGSERENSMHNKTAEMCFHIFSLWLQPVCNIQYKYGTALAQRAGQYQRVVSNVVTSVDNIGARNEQLFSCVFSWQYWKKKQDENVKQCQNGSLKSIKD